MHLTSSMYPSVPTVFLSSSKLPVSTKAAKPALAFLPDLCNLNLCDRGHLCELKKNFLSFRLINYCNIAHGPPLHGNCNFQLLDQFIDYLTNDVRKTVQVYLSLCTMKATSVMVRWNLGRTLGSLFQGKLAATVYSV